MAQTTRLRERCHALEIDLRAAIASGRRAPFS
jgi:hypothetical protein